MSLICLGLEERIAFFPQKISCISLDFQVMFTSHAKKLLMCLLIPAMGSYLLFSDQDTPAAGIWKSMSLCLDDSGSFILSPLRGRNLEPNFPLSTGLCCGVRLPLESM